MRDGAKLGIGTLSLTGRYGRVSLTECSLAIRTALNSGLEIVDITSGCEDAEGMMGLMLKDYPSVKILSQMESFQVGEKAFSAQDIRGICEKTLSNLKREQIECYILEGKGINASPEEVVEVIKALKKEGKINQFGMRKSNSLVYKKLLEEKCLDVLTFEYSALERSEAETLFATMGDNSKYQMIGYGITGRGYLSGAISDLWAMESGDIRKELPLFCKAKMEGNEQVLKVVSEIAREKGIRPVQVAIAWILSDPRLDIALMGSSDYKHVIENVQALEVELTEEELDYLDTTTYYAEKRFIEKELHLMESILKKDIVDIEHGQRQLLHVIKMAVAKEMIEEERILPLFFNVYQMNEHNRSIRYLNFVREQIRELLEVI